MKYWINLFTWNTWKEFMNAGGEISGFRAKRWRTVQRIKPGDELLCYMTGISRFFAILEVMDKPFKSDRKIWGEAIFPCRVPVRVLLSLEPEHAVPVVTLREKLSYFQNIKSPHAWSGHFRGSPTEEKAKDAEVIITALREAEKTPIVREFDRHKLERRVPVYETNTGNVSNTFAKK